MAETCNLREKPDIPSIGKCPKRMHNGPCGGQVQGRCEVNKAIPCVWIQVYLELKKKGELNILREVCLR